MLLLLRARVQLRRLLLLMLLLDVQGVSSPVPGAESPRRQPRIPSLLSPLFPSPPAPPSARAYKRAWAGAQRLAI